MESVSLEDEFLVVMQSNRAATLCGANHHTVIPIHGKNDLAKVILTTLAIETSSLNSFNHTVV